MWEFPSDGCGCGVNVWVEWNKLGRELVFVEAGDGHMRDNQNLLATLIYITIYDIWLFSFNPSTHTRNYNES